MKLLLLFLFVVQLQAFEYGLKPVKVSEHIYCFFGQPEAMNKINNGNMANSCFVDVKGSWLVVDSGPTYHYAKEAFSKIKSIKSQPVSYVVNTHVHDDHWLGNGFYKERGAEIIGSVNFKSEVNPHETTRMQKNISAVAYKNTVVTLPSKFIDKDTQLHIGKTLVELIHLKGSGHTNGDIIVYIPEYKAAFAGDLIFNGRVLSLRDGNINNWIAILKHLETMPLKYLIGGHGTVTDKSSLVLTKKYLEMLKKAVKSALKNDDGIEKAVATINFSEFENIPMYKQLHKGNINKAYQLLEWDDE